MTKEENLYAALLCKFSKGIGNIRGAKILSDKEELKRLEKENSHLRPSIQREIDLIAQNSVSITTLLDEDYPRTLRFIHNAPILLYYYGTLPQGFSFAIVGTRRPTRYSVTTTQLVVSQFSEFRIPIISGFAYGIDTVAHQAALENDLPTVAVLGAGIDIQYPSVNTWMRRRIVKTGGCLISEFPLGTRPHPGNFPIRNRIISGLSSGILVVEAANRSGSLITAEVGLEQGKNIYTIPGTVFGDYFKGNHKLARMGATLIENGYQILADYPQFRTLVEGREQNPNPPYKEVIKQEGHGAVSKNKPRSQKQSVPVSEDLMSSSQEAEMELKKIQLKKELAKLDADSTSIYNILDKPRTLEEIMVMLRMEEAGKVLSILTDLLLRGLIDERGGVYYLSD